MHLLLPLLLCILPYFPNTLTSAQRIAIDPVTCAQDVTDNLSDGFRTAIGWAQQAYDELSKPNNARNARVFEKVDMLIGLTNINLMKIQGAFFAVAQFSVTNSNPRDQAWKNTATHSDVEVYCNANHITPRTAGNGKVEYYDNIRQLVVPTNRGLMDLINKDKQSMAGTLSSSRADLIRNPGLNQVADTMTINEGWITAIKKNGFNHFSQKLVDDSANPSALTKMDQSFDRMFEWSKGFLGGDAQPASPVDLMDSLERLLFHELTHTWSGTQTEDIPPGKCYFWLNCVKAKTKVDATNNADSIAWLAVAIEVILNRGHDITDKGKVVKFS